MPDLAFVQMVYAHVHDAQYPQLFHFVSWGARLLLKDGFASCDMLYFEIHGSMTTKGDRFLAFLQRSLTYASWQPSFRH